MWENFSENNVCQQMEAIFWRQLFTQRISWQRMVLSKWLLLSWVKCLHHILRNVLTKHSLESNVCEQTVFWRSQLFHTRAPIFHWVFSLAWLFPTFYFSHNIEKRLCCGQEYEVDSKLSLEKSLWWFSLLLKLYVSAWLTDWHTWIWQQRAILPSLHVFFIARKYMWYYYEQIGIGLESGHKCVRRVNW